MDKDLKFLESYTIAQFKHLTFSEKIQVKRNPQNKNLFFTYGANKVGAVAKKGIPEHPIISKVQGKPTPENPKGKPFYLLHEEGQGKAEVMATF